VAEEMRPRCFHDSLATSISRSLMWNRFSLVFHA